MSNPYPHPVPDANPYAAPQARVADLQTPLSRELASRGARFGAAMIDWLAYMVPAAVLWGLLFTAMRNGHAPQATATTMLIVAGLLLVAVVVANLILVIQSQQTIGKKLLKIQIVRGDGSACSPLRIIFLRGFVTSLLSGIPFVGGIFALLDPLLIFRDNRRCLHDDIADTIVVNI